MRRNLGASLSFRSFSKRLPGLVAASLAAFVGVGAALSGLGLSTLPHDLEVLRARLPVVFALHMVAGGLGLVLATAAIAVRRRPALHRPFGYAAMLLLAAAALAALPAAMESLASPLARAGFAAQAVVCLGCLGAGWRAIRHRDIGRHRRMMAAAAATASGAVVLRLMLIGIDAAGLQVGQAYGIAAWLAWLLPLAGVAVWLRLAPSPR